MLGGELDVYQDKLSSFLPLVESGDIKAMVVLNDKRVDTPVSYTHLDCSANRAAPTVFVLSGP